MNLDSRIRRAERLLPAPRRLRRRLDPDGFDEELMHMLRALGREYMATTLPAFYLEHPQSRPVIEAHAERVFGVGWRATL
jgi:hypothetical protein